MTLRALEPNTTITNNNMSRAATVTPPSGNSNRAVSTVNWGYKSPKSVLEFSAPIQQQLFIPNAASSTAASPCPRVRLMPRKASFGDEDDFQQAPELDLEDENLPPAVFLPAL